MPANRIFDFPISTLLRDSKLFLGALRDATVGPRVAARLKKKDPDPAKPPLEFAPRFEAQITLVEKGGTAQGAAKGELGELTEEEAAAYRELERLMAGTRRSAGYAFPGNTARLHGEFQIGVHSPQDLGSELERAVIILAAARTHADALSEHGWVDSDADDLEAAITTLGGGDTAQRDATGKKKGITASRNAAANALYKMCLSLQNAARLAYPNTKAGDPAVIEARTRYLLDEFPPRGGASAGDKPATGPDTPPAK